MALFQYKALNSDGTMTEGSVEAAGRQEAFMQLEGRGLNPVVLAKSEGVEKSSKTGLKLEWKRKNVSNRMVENFTRQLSSFLSAGVSLSRALFIQSREAKTPAARHLWKEIHDLVIDGTSLADTMARFPKSFPRVYIAMVKAGETGGFLDIVLGQIAEFQSRERDLKSRVLSALIYPIILMMLAVCVLVFLLVFFIPRFQSIFSDFGAALPLLTRIVVSTSKIVSSYGAFVLIGIGIGALIVQKWLKSDNGRRTFQNWLLKIPVIGSLLARFAMTRFCRMLGTLIGSGVPLINALRVASESIGNQTLTDAVINSIDRVQKGDGLAASLSDCPVLFPGSVLEMISVAEETGRLNEELIRIAETTEKDLDRQLQTTVALAEPLLLFLMAGFIGILFVGMVMPIFSIQDYIK